MSPHLVYTALFAVACLWPSSSAALARTDMAFPHAMTPMFRWLEPLDMQLSGVPVVVRGFMAAATLEQTAKVMARHERYFQRVTTLPGSVLLSGVHAGRHWVAQLEAGPGHVRGMVSALPLNIEQSSGAQAGGFLVPWLTQHAGLVFSQSSGVSGRRVMQGLYRPDQSAAAFVASLNKYLVASGWRRSGTNSWAPVSDRNQDEGRRVEVFPMRAPQGRGDVVLISYSD